MNFQRGDQVYVARDGGLRATIINATDTGYHVEVVRSASTVLKPGAKVYVRADQVFPLATIIVPDEEFRAEITDALAAKGIDTLATPEEAGDRPKPKMIIKRIGPRLPLTMLDPPAAILLPNDERATPTTIAQWVRDAATDAAKFQDRMMKGRL